MLVTLGIIKKFSVVEAWAYPTPNLSQICPAIIRVYMPSKFILIKVFIYIATQSSTIHVVKLKGIIKANYRLALELGTRRFHQQNYWNNRNTKATSKMLA